MTRSRTVSLYFAGSNVVGRRLLDELLRELELVAFTSPAGT